MKYSPREMKNHLDQKGFQLKKKYGQNFIVDENVITSIIRAAAIPNDTLVIEIGPGAGSLTYKLASVSKNVICYEIDKDIKEVLDSNLQNCKNVEVIYEDFLTAQVSKDLAKYSYQHLYVVANLPYYITTPILEKIIEDGIPVDKIVIMVQKEVGDRFRATPGSKEYNSLSIYLNYYFDIKKELDISRNVFLPKPNVDSIVLSLVKKEQKYVVTNPAIFFKLVRTAFVQKRKTMKNNLRKYPLDMIEDVLRQHGFDLSSRAEQLPIDVFVDIANELSKHSL